MAFAPKAATTGHPRALPDQPYAIPPAMARRNTPIDPAIVMCYNCDKNGHFILFCLELKNIGDIKEIEEGEMFDKLGKKEP